MSDIIVIPPALILGCNTPHGINVLSDYIEEQTGHPPDFAGSGWSNGSVSVIGGGYVFYGGNGFGDGCVYGYGSASEIGNGSGVGFEDGHYYSDDSGGGVGLGYGSSDGGGNGCDYQYN